VRDADGRAEPRVELEHAPHVRELFGDRPIADPAIALFEVIAIVASARPSGNTDAAIATPAPPAPASDAAPAVGFGEALKALMVLLRVGSSWCWHPAIIGAAASIAS
jgi:hypothetical protein